MITIATSHGRRNVTLKAMLIATGLTCGAVSLAHPQLENFEMTVVSDAAFGRKVMDGKLESAIRGIEASTTRPALEFFAQNNLCVAYTKTGQFNDAEKACDAAIAKTLPARQLKASGYTQVDRRYAAMALSNRGVLRALMGEKVRAEEDFSAAVDLKARIGAPKRNLEYLQTRADGAVTLLQTDQ